jgi:adenylate kinase
MQPIETREHSRAFDLPSTPEKIPQFISSILQGYKLVLVMGISGTGKTSLLKNYKGLPSWTHTLWNRDTIFDMMWNDGTRDESFYKKIDKFEADIFPELVMKPYHQVIVETWARFPSSRSRYLSFCPKGLGRTQIIVMDGPLNLIVDRNIRAKNHEKFNKSELDLKLFLQEKYRGIYWPTFKEGWNTITYINTFGEEGRKYLQARLV